MKIDLKGLLGLYEKLRSYVLGEPNIFSHPPGLDLFLKKGFLNWAKIQKKEVWSKPLNVGTAEKKDFCKQGTEQEITLILANMILVERGSNVRV